MALAQFSFLALLLAGYGWSITTLVLMFTRLDDFSQDFAIYTLASAFLLILLESYFIYSLCNDNDSEQLAKAAKLSVACYIGWSIYSLFLFFLYPEELPSTDIYGGLTISFLIFFSFPLYLPPVMLGIFFLVLFEKCCTLVHRFLFIALFLSFFITLATLLVFTFLAQSDQNYLTLLSALSTGSLLISLLLTHGIARILDTTAQNTIPSKNFLFFQIFINLIFPIIPLAFFALFLLEIMHNPLFYTHPTHSQLTIVILFITLISALFGPLAFSIFILNEYKSRFIEFFRVRIFDLLFQLEQILQIGEMMIIAIVYFNSIDTLEWMDTAIFIFGPLIFYIIAYTLEGRKLKVILNYAQFSDQEIKASINNYSMGMMALYVVCLAFQITLSALSSDDISYELKFLQIAFIALTAYNLLFNVTKVWFLSLDTITNLSYNIPFNDDQLIDNQPQIPRVNLEIVLDSVDLEKESADVDGLYGQVCSICLESFVDGSVIERQEKPKPISKIKSCGHCFHSECIAGWLESRDFCPLDRKNVRGP